MIDGSNRYDGYSYTIYRQDPDNPHSMREDFLLPSMKIEWAFCGWG
jgi:hypothetical protein